MYGEQPQIMTGAQMPSLAALNRVLESPEWTDLTRLLLDYVENLKIKVVPARSGFQI